jgi:LPXTG-motif cell wall-anchored protein
MTNTIRYNIDNIAIQNMRDNPIEETDYVYATGIRGFVRRRRSIADKRRAMINKIVDAKVKAKISRADAKKITAQSKIESAKSDAAMSRSLGTSPKKSNMGLYIGLGVGALVLIGAAFYFLKKKK